MRDRTHNLGTGRLVVLFVILFASSACENSKLSRLEIVQLKIDPPKYAILKIIDYCPNQTEQPLDLFLANESYHYEVRKDADKVFRNLLLDTDRDGLADIYDTDLNPAKVFGITPKNADSNADGYSDLIIARAGIDLVDQEALTTCTNPEQDTDGDGVNDCGEGQTRTNKLAVDSDGDGLTDDQELRAGLDPNNANDASADSDGDALTNYEEAKLGLDLRGADDEDSRKLLGVRYEVEARPNGLFSCFNYKITVPVVTDEQGNRLKIRQSLRVSGSDKPVWRHAIITLPKVFNSNEPFTRKYDGFLGQ